MPRAKTTNTDTLKRAQRAHARARARLDIARIRDEARRVIEKIQADLASELSRIDAGEYDTGYSESMVDPKPAQPEQLVKIVPTRDVPSPGPFEGGYAPPPNGFGITVEPYRADQNIAMHTEVRPMNDGFVSEKARTSDGELVNIKWAR